MPDMIDQKRIDDLVARPTESLNIEVKRWISPHEPEGIAKIARAALALRNRNGGFLIIGFDDQTMQPDVAHAPTDIREIFHGDKIQAIVSKLGGVNYDDRLPTIILAKLGCRRVA